MNAVAPGSSQHSRTARALAWFTLVFAGIFAPVETAVSWRYGLLTPHYLVDAVGVVLLFAGAFGVVRRRSSSSIALMTVGWAWMSANFWRATMERQFKLEQGGQLDFQNEVQLAAAMTGLAMLCMSAGIWLTLRSEK